MYVDTETLSAGIDWLTMTLPQSNPVADIWVEHCLPVLDDIKEQGYELKYRSLQGYYGLSAGNCFVGGRDDGIMIQLTGHHANDHFTRVYHPEAHYSRIDVQCTVKYKEVERDIAKRAYQSCEASNQRLSSARRRKLLLLLGSDGGDTLYIGSRTSNQQCRIYNKERQSEDIQYTRSWRYEIVYRNELSTALARSTPLKVSERAQWAEAVVYSWLKERGVCDFWNRDSGTVVLPISRTLPTDIEARLQWIRKQVAPTLRKLVDAGYNDELL